MRNMHETTEIETLLTTWPLTSGPTKRAHLVYESRRRQPPAGALESAPNCSPSPSSSSSPSPAAAAVVVRAVAIARLRSKQHHHRQQQQQQHHQLHRQQPINDMPALAVVPSRADKLIPPFHEHAPRPTKAGKLDSDGKPVAVALAAD
jgi:hypothetical protein